ncbi:MAG: GntR family transcriptional regulator [Eubacteriales bacterium]|nr:GntR family transcriptional regulator [Eubacteriales bacterium]
MAWVLNPDRPIYLQLVEHIRLQIVSGHYPPGSRLPSVRDLAGEAAVNPNTMQKALGELERLELLYTQRTSGRYITEDVQRIAQVKQDLAYQQIHDFFVQMERLGYGKDDCFRLMEAVIEGGKQ